jgi:hypothetical protein
MLSLSLTVFKKQKLDRGIMALITVAITIERPAPGPTLVARVLGIFILVAGALLIARTLGLA